MQVSFLDFTHNTQSIQHLGHGVQSQAAGRIPHRTVWNARALGNQVEDIIAVLDGLGTGWESEKDERIL